MTRLSWFACALCAALALPGASAASPFAAEAASKEGKPAEGGGESPDEAEASEAAAPDDIGDPTAGQGIPGRESGGGSGEVLGAEEILPALGEPNITGTPKARIVLRDGTTLEGKLTHVFKGSDKWNADPQPSPQFTVNVDIHELKLDWKAVRTVTVRDVDPTSGIDCWSNLDAVPLEYECTLAQPTFVKMKTTHQYQGDYKVVDREPFTFVLDGDPNKRAVLYLYKIPLRIQDDGIPESEALAKIQAALKERNQKGLKSLTIE